MVGNGASGLARAHPGLFPKRWSSPLPPVPAHGGGEHTGRRGVVLLRPAGLCYRDRVLNKEDGVSHHYFERTEASPHDTMLQKQIAKKVVPPGCLLGGVIVAGLDGAGVDPCIGCEGPRNRCGGRPKTSNPDPVLRMPTAGEFAPGVEEMPAHQRAMFRTLCVQTLRKMLAEAKESRDERNRSWSQE